MPVHRMHLRGPWEFSLTPAKVGPSMHAPILTGTAKMPQSWQSLFGAMAGTARFRRRFHCPTNLEAHERVFIALTEVDGHGDVLLNGTPVGHFDATQSSSPSFEITPLLERSNELQVELTFDPSAASGEGGLTGLVALEIRSD